MDSILSYLNGDLAAAIDNYNYNSSKIRVLKIMKDYANTEVNIWKLSLDIVNIKLERVNCNDPISRYDIIIGRLTDKVAQYRVRIKDYDILMSSIMRTFRDEDNLRYEPLTNVEELLAKLRTVRTQVDDQVMTIDQMMMNIIDIYKELNNKLPNDNMKKYSNIA